MKKDHYFKKMKSVDWFSWRLYQDKDIEIPLYLLLLLTGGISIGVINLGLWVNPLRFLWLLITVPSFVLLWKASFVWFTYETMSKYQKLNRSYYIQLLNDKEKRYYSQWYLEYNKDLLYSDTSCSVNRYSWEKPQEAIQRLERDIPLHCTELAFKRDGDRYTAIYRVGLHSDLYYSRIDREEDRKHWKNTIPENRVLSYWEFLKYRKKKNKLELIQKEMKNIEEFKKYYGLEVKEIDEIVK